MNFIINFVFFFKFRFRKQREVFSKGWMGIRRWSRLEVTEPDILLKSKK